MPITKRVQKVGNTRAILLTRDVAAHLGVDWGDAVELEFYGSDLIVRKAADPDAPETPIRGWRERIIEALEERPKRTRELAEEFGVPRQNLAPTPRQLREEGVIVREDFVNRLA